MVDLFSIWQVPCQKLERRSCEAQVACSWKSLEPMAVINPSDFG